MEYEINLEALIKMKRVFEEADEDGSGELDIEEFTTKLGPHLGGGALRGGALSDADVAQLFLKIDADAGGTIDWDEFTNFFFLQRGVTHGAGDAQRRLIPKATWRKDWASRVHRDATQRLYACEPLEKYISCARDGTFRLWNMKDLAPVQSVTVGAAAAAGGAAAAAAAAGAGLVWPTDCAYLEGQRRLLVASMDRSLSYYSVVRHCFEYSGRLVATGQMGAPQCLAVLDGETPDPQVFYGDSTGAVVQLKCGPPPPHTDRLLGPRDYQLLHQEHTDWVTQLLDIPEVGLLSSSLDGTVKILDLGRGQVANTFRLHRKAVRSMAYSRAFSLVASAGPERSVLLWPPKGNINRRVGELAGHSAGVVQVVMADAHSQAITLSEDSIVRVWDLRNHGCVQTINRADWLRQEDARPEALLYDSRRCRLLTAGPRPALWDHLPARSDKGHSGRLVAALYNSAFHVVVSGDQSGTILMWNAQNGCCEGGFAFNAPCASPAGAAAAGSPLKPAPGSGSGQAFKLTALAFDANQRRLLTASEAGELKMWNFNSGALLREYVHREGRKEITAVAFLTPQDQQQQEQEQEAEEGQQQPEEGQRAGGGGFAEGGSSPASGSGSGGGRDWQREQEVAGAGVWRGSDGVEDWGRGAAMREQEWDVAGSGACGATAGGGQGQEEEEEEDGPPSLVLATGWSRSVCVWEDADGAVVSDYRRLERHEGDVLSMACMPGNARVVATGDFEGGIKLWDLEAGACIASWEYGGAQWERAVGKLAFLPAPAPAASWEASGSGEEDSPGSSGALGGGLSCEGGSSGSDGSQGMVASSLLLACGQDGMMKLWEVSVRDAPCRDHSSGQEDSGAASACRPASQPQRQQKQAAGRVASAASARVASAASAGRAAAGLRAGGGGDNNSNVEAKAAGTALLCSVRLVGQVRGAQRQRDCVTAVAVAEALCSSGGSTGSGSISNNTGGAGSTVLLLSGDSSGYVRVWSVGTGRADCSAELVTPAPLRQVGQWRARCAAIVSLQQLPQRQGGQLVLVGSDDATVSLWTLQGGLVGVFGQHSWDLEDRATWRQAQQGQQGQAGIAGMAAAAAAGWHCSLAGAADSHAEPEQGSESGSGSLTPREIMLRSPRSKVRWELPGGSEGASAGSGNGSLAASPRRLHMSRSGSGSGSSAGSPLASPRRLHPSRSSAPAPAMTALAGAAGAASGGTPSSSDAASGALPAIQEGAAVGEVAGGAVGAAAAGIGGRDGAAGRLLAEAAHQSRAARDSWQIPVSVQAHGALGLHGLTSVPADSSQIWSSIKGYRGTGRERRSVKQGKGAGQAGNRQRAAQVQAILNKAAPAFGRSSNSQHLSLAPEREAA